MSKDKPYISETTETTKTVTIKNTIQFTELSEFVYMSEGESSGTIRTTRTITIKEGTEILLLNFDLKNIEETETYYQSNIKENTEEGTTEETVVNVDLKEVEANLEEIKKILISIAIICGIGIMYSFTSGVLGNRR